MWVRLSQSLYTTFITFDLYMWCRSRLVVRTSELSLDAASQRIQIDQHAYEGEYQVKHSVPGVSKAKYSVIG